MCDDENVYFLNYFSMLLFYFLFIIIILGNTEYKNLISLNSLKKCNDKEDLLSVFIAMFGFKIVPNISTLFPNKNLIKFLKELSLIIHNVRLKAINNSS